MPKLKTKKAIAKRVRVTKTGKVVRLKKSRQHFARRGSGRALRDARKPVVVFKAEAEKMKALIGA